GALLPAPTIRGPEPGADPRRVRPVDCRPPARGPYQHGRPAEGVGGRAAVGAASATDRRGGLGALGPGLPAPRNLRLIMTPDPGYTLGRTRTSVPGPANPWRCCPEGQRRRYELASVERPVPLPCTAARWRLPRLTGAWGKGGEGVRQLPWDVCP